MEVNEEKWVYFSVFLITVRFFRNIICALTEGLVFSILTSKMT